MENCKSILYMYSYGETHRQACILKHETQKAWANLPEK